MGVKCIALLACAAVLLGLAAASPSDAEYEALADRLSDVSIELVECQSELQRLQAAAEALERQQAQAGTPLAEGEQDVRGELARAQAELALIEERLEAADAELAADASSEAATGRDLRVLAGQLSATRLALVEARAALAAQEARLSGSCAAPAVAEGSGQALLLELQECREDVASLREGAAAAAAAASAATPAGCEEERGLVAEARRRIAELAAENMELSARLAAAAAAQPTCPPAPPCACPTAPPCNCEATHVAPVVDTSAARPSRRTELLHNQAGCGGGLQGRRSAQQKSNLLADALGEVQQLEEENERLKASMKALQWEAGALSELRASLEASRNRSAQLSEDLARTAGSLQASERRVEELASEREALKSSLANSEAHKASCSQRAGTLVESQRRLQDAAADAEQKLKAANAACDERLMAAEAAAAKHLAAAEARHAAALEEAQQRLAAEKAAVTAAEHDKAAAVAERRSAEAATAAAEAARRDAEVARAAAEAKLQLLQEAKEAEIARLERLLAAHEEAERERQLAAKIMREAETGWLPLWAQRRWRAASASAVAQAGALSDRLSAAYHSVAGRAAAATSSAWQAASAAVGGRLGPVVATAQQAAGSVWERRLRPLLNRRVRNWPEAEAALRRYAREASERAGAAVGAAQLRAVEAKAAADAAVLRQLQRAPALSRLATPQVASAAVWSAISLFTIPLAWALVAATLRWLLFRLRPGRVAVVPPASSGAWSRLEAQLGYQFEQDATRRQAVDGGSGSQRFAWLGSAVLQLLAAEAAFQAAGSATGPDALAAAAAARGDEAAVSELARAAGMPRWVQPGPGAKSLALGAAKERELYAACLGAAFVDGGYELEPARRVFARPAAPASNGSKPAAANGAASTAAAAN